MCSVLAVSYDKIVVYVFIDCYYCSQDIQDYYSTNRAYQELKNSLHVCIPLYMLKVFVFFNYFEYCENCYLDRSYEVHG